MRSSVWRQVRCTRPVDECDRVGAGRSGSDQRIDHPNTVGRQPRRRCISSSAAAIALACASSVTPSPAPSAVPCARHTGRPPPMRSDTNSEPVARPCARSPGRSRRHGARPPGRYRSRRGWRPSRGRPRSWRPGRCAAATIGPPTREGLTTRTSAGAFVHDACRCLLVDDGLVHGERHRDGGTNACHRRDPSVAAMGCSTYSSPSGPRAASQSTAARSVRPPLRSRRIATPAPSRSRIAHSESVMVSRPVPTAGLTLSVRQPLATSSAALRASHLGCGRPRTSSPFTATLAAPPPSRSDMERPWPCPSTSSAAVARAPPRMPDLPDTMSAGSRPASVARSWPMAASSLPVRQRTCDLAQADQTIVGGQSQDADVQRGQGVPAVPDRLPEPQPYRRERQCSDTAHARPATSMECQSEGEQRSEQELEPRRALQHRIESSRVTLREDHPDQRHGERQAQQRQQHRISAHARDQQQHRHRIRDQRASRDTRDARIRRPNMTASVRLCARVSGPMSRRLLTTRMAVTSSPTGTAAANPSAVHVPVWRYAVPATATTPKNRNTATSPRPAVAVWERSAGIGDGRDQGEGAEDQQHGPADGDQRPGRACGQEERDAGADGQLAF